MPIWHIDILRTSTGTFDIGLIKDEANEAAPHRGPRVKVHPLGENMAEMVEKSQGDNQSTSDPTRTTLVESILGTSIALSYSRSTPSAALVPILKVQKLEA